MSNAEYERGKADVQKPVWNEEDENTISDAEMWLDTLCDYLKDSSPECIPNVRVIITKLKSLKDRILPQSILKREKYDTN